MTKLSCRPSSYGTKLVHSRAPDSGVGLKFLYLGAAIGLEVIATLSLRASEGFTKLWFAALMAICYLGSFVALNLVLRQGMPIGVAYGIWAACGVALVAVLGKFFFSDPLTPMMGLGIILIMGGVLLVEFGSGDAHA